MAACCSRTHSTVQERRRTCGDLRNRRRCQGRTGLAVLSWIRPPATPGQPDAPLPADRVDCFLKPRITCRRRPGGSHDPVARPRFRRTDPAVRSRRSLRMRVHRCHPPCTGRADWSDRPQDCRHLPAPGRGSGHAQRPGFESAGIPIGVGSRPTTGKERGNVHLQRGSRYSCRMEQGVMGFAVLECVPSSRRSPILRTACRNRCCRAGPPRGQFLRGVASHVRGIWSH